MLLLVHSARVGALQAVLGSFSACAMEVNIMLSPDSPCTSLRCRFLFERSIHSLGASTAKLAETRPLELFGLSNFVRDAWRSSE